MASEKLFRDIPPFPDDIPTAPVDIISLNGLDAHDDAASQSLLAACRGLGFFMLDLSGNELGNRTIKEIDQLFLAGREIMDLPADVKGQHLHDAPKSLLG
jgi:isopenicillin N synthase-like dioxygenase